MSYSLSANCSNLRRNGRTVYVTVSASGSSSYSGTLYINGSEVGRSWINANGGSTSGSKTLSWDCPGAFSSRSITCRLKYQEWKGGTTGNTYKYPSTGSLGAMTITASFNHNDGTDTVDTETETYDTAWVLPTDPTRKGYIFLGWFDDPEAGNQILASDICQKDADITIYAHWERVGFYIYQMVNGVKNQVIEIYSVQNGQVTQIAEAYQVSNNTVKQL